MTEDQTLGSLYQRSLIHLSILEARADWGALGKAASELAIDKTLLEGNPVIKAHVLFYQSICQEYSVKISTLQEVLNICKNREPKVDERNGVARKGAGSWDRLEQKVCDALGPDYAYAAMQATISQEDLNEGEEEEEDYTETDTGELLAQQDHRIASTDAQGYPVGGDDVPDSALFEDSASAVEMDDAARLTDAHDFELLPLSPSMTLDRIRLTDSLEPDEGGFDVDEGFAPSSPVLDPEQTTRTPRKRETTSSSAAISLPIERPAVKKGRHE